MEKQEIIKEISAATNTTHQKTREILNLYNKIIERSLKKNKKIRLSIGVLKVVTRKAKLGRDLKTGGKKPYFIPEHKTVKLDVSKKFKKELNKR